MVENNTIECIPIDLNIKKSTTDINTNVLFHSKFEFYIKIMQNRLQYYYIKIDNCNCYKLTVLKQTYFVSNLFTIY